MTELSRSEKLAKAREEFKGSVISNEEGLSEARFVQLKAKSSVARGSVSNNVSFKDQLTGRKYNVSVSATVQGDDVDMDALLGLQSVIAKFLQDIHEAV